MESTDKTRNTLVFGVFLLFFFQLFGMWLESMYRMSLTRLGPGSELYGTVLLLLPLAVYALGERHERFGLWVAVLLFLVCRLLCPHLGSVSRIVVGGVGVSAFLAVLAFVSSMRFSALKGDPGLAVGMAILLSAAFRAWGATVDISTEGWTVVLGWVLAALALFLFRGAMAERLSVDSAVMPGRVRSGVAMLGLFASFALVVLVLSCPMVICAWKGYGEIGHSGLAATACLAAGLAVTLLLAPRIVRNHRLLMLAWNVLFVSALVGALLLGRPVLPGRDDPSAVYVSGGMLWTGVLLHLSLLMAPVVVFNVRGFGGVVCGTRPKDAVLPVLFGMGLMLSIAYVLIFTNVWGYVSFGGLWRNRFYMPFLVAGLAMILPWTLRPVAECACGRVDGRIVGGIAVVFAVLGLVGAAVVAPRVADVAPKQELTILTYNMQQGSHLDGNRNYANQLALLRGINADIIGLQECDTPRPSAGNVDAVRYLATALGYHAYYGPCSIAGTYGTAILSRYPIRNPRTFYTYSRVDEVGTAVGEIMCGDATIAFFCNHPAGGRRVMTAHVNALKAEAGKYARVIAVGDYNFTPQEPYFGSLSELLQDSATQLGEANTNYHGRTPNLADEIDHIFVTPNFRTLESHYLAPPDSQTDHPAHWSMLRME